MNDCLPEVRLRAIEPEDLEVFYEIENDVEVWDVGVTNVPYSRFALSNYIATASSDIYADKQVRLVVETEKGEVAGLFDLYNFDPRHSRAEVGIVIAKALRGKGYAKAALESALRYSRNIIHLSQLYAVVDIDNNASLHLFQSVGFQKTALLQKWLRVGDTYRDAALLQFFL